jgi:hypothetical protein
VGDIDITEALLGSLDGAEITMDVGKGMDGTFATRITVINIEDEHNAELLGDTIVELIINYGVGVTKQ